MKKQLLTIISALSLSAIMAQTPSPSWPTLQNTNYTLTSASCKFLDVVSSNVVWAVGYSGSGISANYNQFTRSINGGASFNIGNVYADTNTYVISNLEGVDANTAWVSAYLKSSQNKGAIHKTTNGGTTWTNMTTANMFTNTASFANFVSFLTPSIGIAMGDPQPGIGNEFEIWRTIDAGATWTLVPGANIPNPSSASEYGIVNVYEKSGTSNIWFGTNAGRIFRSTDAGVTWSVTALPGTPLASLNVSDIAFSSANNGIAYVFNTSTVPSTFEEYVTSNGGATWTQVSSINANIGKNDVSGVPGTNIFVSCANTSTANPSNLSYSKDGGITWIDWGSVNIPYLAIDFADATSGWAATFQTGTVPTGGIYKFVGPTSIFNLSANSVCLSGPSASISTTNMSLGGGTYTWTSGSGVAFSAATGTNTNITFTSTGIYTISLLSNNGFTTNVATQTVNVLSCISPSVSFTIPTGTLCNLAAFTLTNTSTGSPTPTYSWSTSPATNVTISPNSTATSPSMTFSNPGVYSITLLATNINGTASITQTVNITNCAPVANFNLPSTANTCSVSAMISLTNTSTGTGPFSYTWTVMGGMGAGATFTPNAAAASPSLIFTNTVATVYTITLNQSNPSGVSSITKTLSVSYCVGIAENNLLAGNVKLYPNPAKDVVTVGLPHNGSEYNVVVTDILGSIIYNQKAKSNSDLQINLGNKAKGIYFITIQGANEKATKKIIVE